MRLWVILLIYSLIEIVPINRPRPSVCPATIETTADVSSEAVSTAAVSTAGVLTTNTDITASNFSVDANICKTKSALPSEFASTVEWITWFDTESDDLPLDDNLCQTEELGKTWFMPSNFHPDFLLLFFVCLFI